MHVDIFTDDTKAITGKNCGALAQIDAVVPNCTCSHCILPLSLSKKKKRREERPISLKNVLDEIVETVKKKLTHLYPVWNIPCDVGNMEVCM